MNIYTSMYIHTKYSDWSVPDYLLTAYTQLIIVHSLLTHCLLTCLLTAHMIYKTVITGATPPDTIHRPISSQTEPTSAFKLIIVFSPNVPADVFSNVVYQQEVKSNRRPSFKKFAHYLNKKLSHCKTHDTFKAHGGVLTYSVTLTCNLEWLISVIETEIDYHIGKKRCTRKYNSEYMHEYEATQLSGFGEKFYDAHNNISDSIIGRVYKLKL